MECRAMPCLPLKLARNVGSVAFRFRRTSCARGPSPEGDLARATLSRRMSGWAADPVALWMETPSPPKPNPKPNPRLFLSELPLHLSNPPLLPPQPSP